MLVVSGKDPQVITILLPAGSAQDPKVITRLLTAESGEEQQGISRFLKSASDKDPQVINYSYEVRIPRSLLKPCQQLEVRIIRSLPGSW